jgi:hypothetical protein
MNNNNTNNASRAQNGPWCPPGRTVTQMHGKCYCDAPQYSVKPQCLPEKPDCYVEQLGNGYTFYGQDTGAYITHGKNRIES